MIAHIAANQGAWTVIAIGLIAAFLFRRKYRRDVAEWNAAHPHRSFGSVS